MVEAMRIMVTSFKRSHACTAALSTSNPAAGYCQPIPLPEMCGHSRASLLESLLLSPGSWCIQGFACALQESVSPALLSSDGFMVGLVATSSKRVMPYPGLLHPEPLPLRQATADHTSAGDTQTQLCLSLCGFSGSWCAQGLFEPSECLWRVWGLILNAVSPILLCCWGFSFVLGRGVSFCGGIQHSPVDGCSAASCNFGVLTGEDECTSFCSTIFLTTSFCSLLLVSWSLLLLRNLYAGQEATARIGHGTTDCFQIRKEYIKAICCHPACLTICRVHHEKFQAE